MNLQTDDGIRACTGRGLTTREIGVSSGARGKRRSLSSAPPTNMNVALAANLREYADLLEQQHADRFRIAAYRRAADVLDGLDRPVAELLARGGRKALEALPAIGSRIGAAIAEMLGTGRWSQLDRLKGQFEPEALFRTIPGIGPELAARICSELHVETLHSLEMAAYDGRLDKLPGIGNRRLQMVRAALAERLGRPRMHLLSRPSDRPQVAMLLDVDREYREQAARSALPLISPQRFNPEGRAWLPVLHTTRGPWELTALYSNTRRAHELGRIRDWVVIHYQREDRSEDQCTVVTERHGALAGRRVVRGREIECQSMLLGDAAGRGMLRAGDAGGVISA